MSNTPVCDLHCYLTPVPGSDAIEQLCRHKESGFDVVFLNLGDAATPLELIIRMAASARSWLAARPQQFVLVDDVAGIRAATASGKLAVAFNIEGSHCVGEQLSLVPLLRSIGVCWMGLVYNRHNQIGSGCHDSSDDGLTKFGREFVDALDRAGIIKCCSHAGLRTAQETMDRSELPTIFSHSNPAALKNHARNIPDETIKACAATGGLVGISGIGILLGQNEARADLLVQHIDYIAQLVGVEHVALGLDYGYSAKNSAQMDLSDQHFWPVGNEYEQTIACVPPESLQDILSGLDKRGYSTDDMAKIRGGNVLRVMDAVRA